MTLKLSGALPTGEDLNGLPAIADDLVADPSQYHVVIAVVDCKAITLDTDTGESVPTARIRRIEVIDDEQDKARLRGLATRAFERRTGKTVLPLELEDELRAAFGDQDGTE